LKDILGKLSQGQLEEKCLDHGFVKLIDCLPRVVPESEDGVDYAIAEAARCSYKRGTKTISDDKVLIRYLMRHDHTSPFEMVKFKFHMKLPIFVARQVVRTRTAQISELSGRYSELPEEYYIPEINDVRLQSEMNKQGSGEAVDSFISEDFREDLIGQSLENYTHYKSALNKNISREQARMFLSLNYYTELYWCMDLHNLLHFLDLRTDSHAQKETRIYAEAILKLITPIVPYTMSAWEDYSIYRGGLKLTKMEVDSIKKYFSKEDSNVSEIDVDSKLEKIEWIEKLKKIGAEKLLRKESK
jgi:thymidylate synthase (FAD)